MDWLVSLFTGNGVAHAIIIYSFVIALGVTLGKVKFFGISLGATFVLFVGLAVSHFGGQVNGDVLKFIQDFGLILFIFSIGLQVGPSFFSSFKKGGVLLNCLAVLIIVLNIVVALTIYYVMGDVKITDLVGIISGAVTNTPGLGAAQQALSETMGSGVAQPLVESMSMGYAAAYPLGVVGIILSMIVVKAIFRINVEREAKEVADGHTHNLLKPHEATYRVTNRLISGLNLKRLHGIIDRNFVVSRIEKPDGTIVVPRSDTVVGEGDVMCIVMSVQDEDLFGSLIGPKEEKDWAATGTPVVSRRILVSQKAFMGRKLSQLSLPKGYRLNVTKVNRARVDLLAAPNLILQMGDRITVEGNIEDINRLAELLGNSKRRLKEPNMLTMFFGIFIGILVGSIPLTLPGMQVPMKLGLAGGPLIVAILLGGYGYKIKLVTYTSSSANLLLRELGICLFLASVGLAAGDNFVATVFNATGARWVAYGFLITLIPLLVVGVIARGKFKINYCTLMGLLAGSTTDPPALAYANKAAGNDAPSVGYSTVYPLTMFLRVIIAQILILALA